MYNNVTISPENPVIKAADKHTAIYFLIALFFIQTANEFTSRTTKKTAKTRTPH